VNSMGAIAAEVAGDPNKVVRFTPAPVVPRGTNTPRSFDIEVADRAAPPGARPQALIEVHTETGVIAGAGDLNAGIAHAASKLPLQKGPKANDPMENIPGVHLPSASKEAAVVLTRWPPVTKNKVYAADGSFELTLPNGGKKQRSRTTW
jgi:hypothetical protein